MKHLFRERFDGDVLNFNWTNRPEVEHNPAYEMSFNINKPIDREEFMKIIGVDRSNMSDAYDIQFVKIIQARKHKKKRINKKWERRYGYKQVLTSGKGWKILHKTDGSSEFIK